jgi:hypothetical protein
MDSITAPVNCAGKNSIYTEISELKIIYYLNIGVGIYFLIISIVKLISWGINAIVDKFMESEY